MSLLLALVSQPAPPVPVPETGGGGGGGRRWYKRKKEDENHVPGLREEEEQLVEEFVASTEESVNVEPIILGPIKYETVALPEAPKVPRYKRQDDDEEAIWLLLH